MRIAVVGSPDDVRGFALAGIEGYPAMTGREAIPILRGLLREERPLGLLLLSRSVADAIGSELAALGRTDAPPAILVLPEASPESRA